MRVTQYAGIGALVIGLTIGCGNKSSTATTPTPTPTQTTPAVATRIISLSGSMQFGNVNVGDTATQAFTIHNGGNATLNITSISGIGGTQTSGLLATFTSGPIAPGTDQVVSVQFKPILAQTYSTVLTVNGDQTSGNNAVNFSGTGINNTPLFSQSGVGNTVFTLPATVVTVKVTGSYTANSSNFTIWIGPAGVACGSSINSSCRLLVNQLIGTFWGTTSYQATLLTGGGGTVQVINSDGVSWTMTEVR
jgi:hypothetical protein